MEILMATLSSMGTDGFEEKEKKLLVYFPENNPEEVDITRFLEEQGYTYTRQVITSQNWNHSWESNFEPVIVEDLVGIRAEFHNPIPEVKHELLITPKMSFGTGHHATTYLMIKAMMELDIINRTVLDFGTGTGVLAILAEKLGALHVLAIDNDEWSISNAAENIEKNACKRIKLEMAEELLSLKDSFDIILANINRQVILDNITSIKRLLKTDSVLLLSGLLKEDREEVKQAFKLQDIKFSNVWERGDWICLKSEY